ncbi:hypothetical protein H6P81_003888 [Aristolochia fimbriata]|uniref:Pentatricopeptide repeat-containing protein n=1 Tax=Aristolochia fimbriata TaxID=158543 RepID=A0AAV7FDW0_ARIFI|nr:hypothetical protein H6P81_003888 [Aristolochia fimbriata]
MSVTLMISPKPYCFKCQTKKFGALRVTLSHYINPSAFHIFALFVYITSLVEHKGIPLWIKVTSDIQNTPVLAFKKATTVKHILLSYSFCYLLWCLLDWCHWLVSAVEKCSHLSFSPPSSSWLTVPGNPLLKWPPSSSKSQLPTLQMPPASQPPGEERFDPVLPKLEDNLTDIDISALSAILKDPCLSEADRLAALDRTNVHPHPYLLETIIQNNNFSPNPILTLYRWACLYPEFCPSPSLINALVNLLSRSRMFVAAWSLILDHLHQTSRPFLISLQTFTLLIRRYARAGMTQSAIRTFEYMHLSKLVPSCDGSKGLDMLLDALCKEGHVSSAIHYLDQVSSAVPPLVIPSAQTYNILINGCFRIHKLRDAERILGNMLKANVEPTVVTYGTLIEGYCKMRRVHRAVELLAEMSMKEIAPNVIVYNSIIDGLAESARLKDAVAMLETMPLHKLQPTILTYNSLVKGYCKVGDLAGASKMLKAMIARGHLPTARTYNYFFAHFAKSGKVEEAMNLYTKMMQSGYEPDRFTFHLVLKLLCENRNLQLALQVIKEMNGRGFDSDTTTCTMLIHLLCRLQRWEDAYVEFEAMMKRGLVPEYITYTKLVQELRMAGMNQMVRRISDLMDRVPHERKLPNTYKPREKEGAHEMRLKILQKAQAMSDVLKTCKDPRELRSRREESAVAGANRLIEDIKRRVYAV